MKISKIEGEYGNLEKFPNFDHEKYIFLHRNSPQNAPCTPKNIFSVLSEVPRDAFRYTKDTFLTLRKLEVTVSFKNCNHKNQ